MSKQDSQHADLEREPLRVARRRVAKPFGLELQYRTMFWKNGLLKWKKWYGTKDARAKAKACFVREKRYENIVEVDR